MIHNYVSCQLGALFYFYSEVQPPLYLGSVSTRMIELELQYYIVQIDIDADFV